MRGKKKKEERERIHDMTHVDTEKLKRQRIRAETK